MILLLHLYFLIIPEYSLWCSMPVLLGIYTTVLYSRYHQLSKVYLPSMVTVCIMSSIFINLYMCVYHVIHAQCGIKAVYYYIVISSPILMEIYQATMKTITRKASITRGQK